MSEALRCDFCGCFGEATEKWLSVHQMAAFELEAFKVYRHWCGECDPRERRLEKKRERENASHSSKWKQLLGAAKEAREAVKREE